MGDAEFTVEEEINKALAALERACTYLKIKEPEKTNGSEAEGDSE